MRSLVLPLAAVALLAGCGGSSHGGPTLPGTTVGGVRVASVIPIHETEYKLEPARIHIERFGYYGIKAVNDGSKSHALKITGHGIDQATAVLGPGKSQTVLVFFRKAGAYKMFDPTDGNAAKGMTGSAVVH